MITIDIVRNVNNEIVSFTLNGHAGYDVQGKDIVCAAVSSIAITTINGIISLDESIDYEEDSGLLKIRVLKDTEVNEKLLNNLVNMLSELVSQYPKNIEIRNED